MRRRRAGEEGAIALPALALVTALAAAVVLVVASAGSVLAARVRAAGAADEAALAAARLAHPLGERSGDPAAAADRVAAAAGAEVVTCRCAPGREVVEVVVEVAVLAPLARGVGVTVQQGRARATLLAGDDGAAVPADVPAGRG